MLRKNKVFILWSNLINFFENVIIEKAFYHVVHI